MLVGGLSSLSAGQPLSDVWAWDNGAWSFITLRGFDELKAAGRFHHALVPGDEGAGVLLFGGNAGATPGTARADLWLLRYDSLAPSLGEVCAAGVDFDHDGKSGCDDTDCWYACSANCPPDTTCPFAATCGDGVCDVDSEQCTTCPADCGACPS